MKVLLINPPIREEAPPNCFPLGLAYVGRVLLDNGHKVSVLDINAHRYKFEQLSEKLKNCDFDVAGITGLITQYKYIKRLTILLKKMYPDKKVIIGGNIASTVPKLLLEKSLADIMAIGEGEVTAVELINALEKNRDLSKVDGIAFKKNKKIVFTKPRQVIENIDTIPLPAWDLFPLKIYFKYSVTGYTQERNMNILTSRGCPFHCTFCYDTFGKKTRFRSPENVIAELKELKRRYGITKLDLYDETFTVHKQRAMEICRRMIDEKLNMKWDCSGRVNCIDEELLRIMKKAGVTHILYGIESGSQKILNEMKKGVLVEQAKKAIRSTRKVGIEFIPTLMIGFPSESRETIEESVNFFKEMSIFSEAFYPTPHPGAPLYDYALQKGLIKDEDKYLESLTHFGRLVVNLTNMPDEKLMMLRNSAVRRIFISYMMKNLYKVPYQIIYRIRIMGLKGFLSNLNSYFRRFISVTN